MRVEWRKTALGLAILAWIGVVLGVYYVVHKPFTLELLWGVAQAGLAPIGFLLTIVTAHGLGRGLARFFPVLTAREKFALQTGMGLAILGLLMLMLGALGGYWNWIIWLLAGLGSLLNARTFWAALRSLWPAPPKTWIDRLLVLFVGGMILGVALNALTPPTAWDSLVYHLTGPKLYIQAHHLHQDIDLAYLGFPHWGSMLFTWSLLLAGPTLAQLIHFLFMVLTVALCPAILRVVAPGNSWLTAAILLAVPTATLLAGWAYVEWLTMFAGVAAFTFLLHIDDTERRDGLAVLAGVATGLALAAKYTAAGLALGLGLWAIIRLRSIKLISLFALGAALALGPYLVKNFVLTGNPVYPFFLPGKFWDVDRAFWYSRPGTGLSPWVIVFAPWDMMAWGVEGAELAGKVSYNATIGPLLLMLTPLALLGWRSRTGPARQALLGLLLVSGVAYSVWAIQLAFSALLIQSRLLFPILPLVAILAAVGFDNLKLLDTKGLRIQFVAGAMVAIALVFTSLDGMRQFLQKPVVPVLVGWQSQTDFLLSRLGAYIVVMDDVNRLPAGSKVVFLWEPRSYYCGETVVCEPDVLLDRWWHARRQELTGTEILQGWRVEGATHVLVFEEGRRIIEQGGFDPFTAEDWAQLQVLRAGDLTLVVDYAGGYQLYELK